MRPTGSGQAENPGARRFYGRRQGRPMRGHRQAMLDLLPSLAIPADKVASGMIAFDGLFPDPTLPVWLEIGFGNGEHLKAELETYPDRCYIGAEPFVNGMTAFLKSIEAQATLHDRVRLWMDDAIPMVHALPARGLSGIFVLNPDPWPKTRHHKRRIISQDNLTAFARALKPGGMLMMTTDVDDLAEWMATQASIHPAFEWTAESPADWKQAPVGWCRTRYELKGAAAGRSQSYLIFRRKDDQE